MDWQGLVSYNKIDRDEIKDTLCMDIYQKSTLPYTGRLLKFLEYEYELSREIERDKKRVKEDSYADICNKYEKYMRIQEYLHEELEGELDSLIKKRDKQSAEHKERYIGDREKEAISIIYGAMFGDEFETLFEESPDGKYFMRNYTEDRLIEKIREYTGSIKQNLSELIQIYEGKIKDFSHPVPYKEQLPADYRDSFVSEGVDDILGSKCEIEKNTNDISIKNQDTDNFRDKLWNYIKNGGKWLADHTYKSVGPSSAAQELEESVKALGGARDKYYSGLLETKVAIQKALNEIDRETGSVGELLLGWLI